MRRRRSTIPAFAVEIIHCNVETHSASATSGDSGENLVHSWGRCKPDQFSGEVLLQRLAGSIGSALEARVHLVRNISDKNVRHACILLSTETRYNRPKPGQTRQI